MFGSQLHERMAGHAGGSRAFLTLAVAVGVVCLFGLAGSARAATVTVTNTSDSDPGSLRAVVAGADGGDTIDFDSSLDGQTIVLTSGAIAIDKSLTITGPGASQFTIDAGHNSQIFTVTAGDLEISGLTAANGAATGGSFVTGGAINYLANGALEISDCAFTGNTAGGAGGAETNSGSGWGGAVHVGFSANSLTVSDCSFVANGAGGDGGSGTGSGRGRGGAIDYRGSGPLMVQGSDFVANSAGGEGGEGVDSGTSRGGAINVSSPADNVPVDVSGSTFTANTAGGDGGTGGLSGQGWGGAVHDDAGSSVTIAASRFDGNTVGGQPGGELGGGRGSGGAIRVLGGGTISVFESTFSGNLVGHAGGSAGAVSSINKALTVDASTFVGNSVGGDGQGGAISASEFGLGVSARISNSTLVGNVAGSGTGSSRGGAIDVSNMFALILESSTISGNSVGEGGNGAGISATGGAGAANASVTARATIVSGNSGAPNCDAPVATSTYSLEGSSAGSTSCGFDLPSADPQLELLDDNGGPTETQALPLSSPAVGAVPAAQCPTSVDQRGLPRPGLGKSHCDVGAYELQGDPVAPQITSEDEAAFQVGKASSFTVAATGVPSPSLFKDGALPDGVGFTDNGDGTATLAGTPAAGAEGSYPITIEADNGTPPDAVQNFTLFVAAPDPPPGPIEPPDCSAPLIASVAPCPGDPPEGPGGPPRDPQTPSPRPLALSLAVERKSLRKLLRSGKLVVAARVNKRVRLTLRGRAKLRVGAGRSARTRLVTVFKRKTVRFEANGKKRVTLALSRKGRRALRGLGKVRLVIVGRVVGAGKTARKRVTLTLRR